MAVVYRPVIPNLISVHLGPPSSKARTITVPFDEYIKNVASNEIYPTWPESAIRANILAQISFALNRIYNEWYRSEGYDFDITSSPAYDQAFVENSQFYENISQIVDELFNDYIVRRGQVQPLFAQYCDGRNVKCDGLSQWDSVTLANEGKSPIEILRYYYGNDIDIITDAEVQDIEPSYMGLPLKIGDSGNEILILKTQLNRISENYPAIPDINRRNVFFDIELENSVRKFQEIFDLPQTGVVDKATWYRIKYIYNAVKKINDLYSEGIKESDVTFEYGRTIEFGDSGVSVRLLNYLLRIIAYFDEEIPFLESTDVFNNNTLTMVKEFQEKYGIEATGIVDRNTWQALNNAYLQTIKIIPPDFLEYVDEFYPGLFLSLGMTGNDIKRLQIFLYRICQNTKSIPGVVVNGVFDELTEESIKVIQQKYNLPVNGVVGPITWYNIVEESKRNRTNI